MEASSDFCCYIIWGWEARNSKVIARLLKINFRQSELGKL